MYSGDCKWLQATMKVLTNYFAFGQFSHIYIYIYIYTYIFGRLQGLTNYFTFGQFS